MSITLLTERDALWSSWLTDGAFPMQGNIASEMVTDLGIGLGRYLNRLSQWVREWFAHLEVKIKNSSTKVKDEAYRGMGTTLEAVALLITSLMLVEVLVSAWFVEKEYHQVDRSDHSWSTNCSRLVGWLQKKQKLTLKRSSQSIGQKMRNQPDYRMIAGQEIISCSIVMVWPIWFRQSDLLIS